MNYQCGLNHNREIVMDNDKILNFEPVTKEQVKALICAAGIGAMIIDWSDIDYELGRGKTKSGHCLFSTDGKRIDIGGYEYGLIVSQTKEKDARYDEYKKQIKDGV